MNIMIPYAPEMSAPPSYHLPSMRMRLFEMSRDAPVIVTRIMISLHPHNEIGRHSAKLMFKRSSINQESSAEPSPTRWSRLNSRRCSMGRHGTCTSCLSVRSASRTLLAITAECVFVDGGVKYRHPSCTAEVRGAPNRFCTCIDLMPRLCSSSSLVTRLYPSISCFDMPAFSGLLHTMNIMML